MDSIKKRLFTFGIHYVAMMRKNALVLRRSPKSTVAQVLAPAIFMSLLAIFQNIPNNDTRQEVVLSNIPICVPKETSRCFTLLYTINTTDIPCNSSYYQPTCSNAFIGNSSAYEIMSRVAMKNGFTLKQVFDINAQDGDTTIYGLDSYQTLLDFIVDHPNETQSAIVFSPIISQSGSGSFVVLFNDTSTDIPLSIRDSVQRSVEEEIVRLYALNSGFPLTVQPNFTIKSETFPAGNNNYFDAVQSLGVLFFYCAIMFNFTIFLYQIVNEKQLQLRQGMRMIGLSDIAYWLSWFTTNVIFLLVYTFVVLIFGYGCGFAFFRKTHFFVLFLLFFVFGLAMTPLAILIGMFLKTTRQAINVGMLVFVIGTVGQLVFTFPILIQILYYPAFAPPAIRILLQFYPPYNFSKMMNDISDKSNEAAVKNLQPGNSSLLFSWNTFYESRDFTQFAIPPAVDSVGYQLMDMFIFIFFSWFFFNILPSEKGNPIWFLFTKNYWGIAGDISSSASVIEDAEDDDVKEEQKKARDSNAELRVLGLKKTFNKLLCVPHVNAVQGISLSVESGTVFALLGHNGAGKTTTINILTGLLKPTSGDCVVHGKSLKNNLPEVQKLIGVCPQHNILWEELSPQEHLSIFADIKGVPKKDQPDMIKARLEDVLLWDVRNKHSGKFSGGMKRRLSVAISAIGDPALVYLDEPTTGLDPMSRREIWNAIQKLKKGRVIMLTTHSMEEADVLGDRIGVMAHGKLKCIGTSLHLKNKFGLGYRLNLSTEPQLQEELKQLVARTLPTSELIAATGGNLVYGVATSDLPQVIPFFQFIEQNAGDESFIIKDWGMSQTTLEEVFLKVTRNDANVTSFV